MPQVDHVSVGATPVDITAGLDPGCYVAQPRPNLADIVGQTLLYATATTAPTDLDDFFRAELYDYFSFTVAADTPPTWARTTRDTLPVAVALARVP